MAARSASALATRPIAKIYASPLQRAQESAAPLATELGLPVDIDERLNEGLNHFQGTRLSAARLLKDPSAWMALHNPFKPSWGEPYREIAKRMMAVAEDAWNSVDEGEVVLVTHQVAIWILHRSVAGIPCPMCPPSDAVPCPASRPSKRSGSGGKRKAIENQPLTFWKTLSIWEPSK